MSRQEMFTYSKEYINCRRISVCYKCTCIICLGDGKSGDEASIYFGETGKNMHCRSKEHISKFNSKIQATWEGSAFYKHMSSMHRGVHVKKEFMDLFEIKKKNSQILQKAIH